MPPQPQHWQAWRHLVTKTCRKWQQHGPASTLLCDVMFTVLPMMIAFQYCILFAHVCTNMCSASQESGLRLAAYHNVSWFMLLLLWASLDQSQPVFIPGWYLRVNGLTVYS